MITILSMLAKTVGPILAQGIMEKLLTTKGATSKLQRAMEAMEKGVSVIAALRGEFGEDFLKAITGTIGDSKAHAWTFEAGSFDYIRLCSEETTQAALPMLRDELNINLDRLVMLGKVSDDALLNYFSGTLGVWRTRYIEAIGLDEEAREIFAAMDDLLDGRKRTFKDALETISKTGLGGTGALMVLSGVLLATGTGVGVATSISIFMFGIPWISVGALVIPGAILLGLSRYKFSNKHAMSTCVKMAYKLLEERYNDSSLNGDS
jgi:hypothetical protein